MREYKTPIEQNEHNDIMPIKTWNALVADGWFITTDGCGYWVKDGFESNDEVFSTPPLDATHVAWYNK